MEDEVHLATYEGRRMSFLADFKAYRQRCAVGKMMSISFL